MNVAKTILMQLGGSGSLKMMLGARDFLDHGNALSFKFPNRRGPNHVKITLESDDSYTVEFGRIVKYVLKNKKVHRGIYAETLGPLFTRETGLNLRLASLSSRDRKRMEKAIWRQAWPDMRSKWSKPGGAQVVRQPAFSPSGGSEIVTLPELPERELQDWYDKLVERGRMKAATTLRRDVLRVAHLAPKMRRHLVPLLRK
jgi:hypothetical protein